MFVSFFFFLHLNVPAALPPPHGTSKCTHAPRHVKSASVESTNGLTVPSATLRSKRSSLNPVNQQFLADVAAATAAVAVADGGGNGDGGGGGGGVHGEGGGGGSASGSGGAARHDFLLNELVASDGQLGPTLRKLCSAGWALCKMCCSNYFLSVSMKTMKATCKRLNGHPRVSKYHTSVSFFKSVARACVCVCVHVSTVLAFLFLYLKVMMVPLL